MDKISPECAVGYDAADEISLETYEKVTDADGVAWVFEMDDDARSGIADCVRELLDRPGMVESLEPEPGYVRLRAAPRRPTAPKAVLEAVRQIPNVYNERHAEGPVALELGEFYIGTYRPEGATAPEAFIDAHTGSDAAPETDAPVFRYERDGAPDEAVYSENRRFDYEFIFPFDAMSMYVPDVHLREEGPVVEWDDEDRETLQMIVEDVSLWPGRLGAATPLVEVYPEYVRVRHSTGAIHDPVRLATRARHAVLRYNDHRGFDEEHSSAGEKVLRAPIEFRQEAYIGVTDDGSGVDEWIEARGLDAEDGAPRDPPEPEPEPDGDGEGPAAWIDRIRG